MILYDSLVLFFAVRCLSSTGIMSSFSVQKHQIWDKKVDSVSILLVLR